MAVYCFFFHCISIWLSFTEFYRVLPSLSSYFWQFFWWFSGWLATREIPRFKKKKTKKKEKESEKQQKKKKKSKEKGKAIGGGGGQWASRDRWRRRSINQRGQSLAAVAEQSNHSLPPNHNNRNNRNNHNNKTPTGDGESIFRTTVIPFFIHFSCSRSDRFLSIKTKKK